MMDLRKLYGKAFVQAFPEFFVGATVARARPKVKAKLRRKPTQLCRYGHDLTEFSRIDVDGRTRCRRCLTLTQSRYLKRKKAAH